MPGPLKTQRKEAFCQAYAADPKRNATRAYIAAGYSKNGAGPSAGALLRDPQVMARITEIWGNLPTPEQRSYTINAEFVLLGLADIAVHGKNEQARTRCYELLGKTAQGGSLFTDRSLSVAPTLRDLPDDQLMQLIDEAKSQLGRQAVASVPDNLPADNATQSTPEVPPEPLQ